MRCGQLRERVTFWEWLTVKATDASEIQVPAEVCTVWAAVEPITGNERWIGELEQRLAERSTRIRIRYRTDITEKMRVTWGTLVYDIQQIINPWARDKELQLICREVNPT